MVILLFLICVSFGFVDSATVEDESLIDMGEDLLELFGPHIRSKLILGFCPDEDNLPDFVRFPREFQERILSSIYHSLPWHETVYDVESLVDVLFRQMVDEQQGYYLILEYLNELSGWLSVDGEVYTFLMGFNQMGNLGDMDAVNMMRLAEKVIPSTVGYSCASMVRFYDIVILSEVGNPALMLTSSLALAGTRVVAPWDSKFPFTVEYARKALVQLGEEFRSSGTMSPIISDNVATTIASSDLVPRKNNKRPLQENMLVPTPSLKKNGPPQPEPLRVRFVGIRGAGDNPHDSYAEKVGNRMHVVVDILDFFHRVPDMVFGGNSAAYERYMRECGRMTLDGVPKELFKRVKQLLVARISVPVEMHEFLLKFNRESLGSPSLMGLYKKYLVTQQLSSRELTSMRVEASIMTNWYELIIHTMAGRPYADIVVNYGDGLVFPPVARIPSLIMSELVAIHSRPRYTRIPLVIVLPAPLLFDYRTEYPSPNDWTKVPSEVAKALLLCFDKFPTQYLSCPTSMALLHPELTHLVSSTQLLSIADHIRANTVIAFNVLGRMIELQKTNTSPGMSVDDIQSLVNTPDNNQTHFQVAEWYQVMFSEKVPGSIFSGIRDVVDYAKYQAIPTTKHLDRFRQLEMERISEVLQQHI